ncbi:MAG TPA: nuclear transport factor 2 family protein [Gemmatimonadaceae bacterium]|nr:nuclear transport factor 2 family protein [Gemmatimonadaceae bacterium]
MTLIDGHREVIDRYLAAYNAFDVAGMIEVLHPNIEFRNVAKGEVTAAARGRDEFRALARRAVTLFTSRRQTVREYGSDGDEAWIAVDYEGVLATDLGPGMRMGDTLRLSGRSTFNFRDGLIVELVDES